MLYCFAFFHDEIREIFISFDGKENVQVVKNCMENFNEKSWEISEW